MRGLLEFAMEDLISNQLLISETFDKMHKLVETDLAGLSVLKEDYVHESIDSLYILWRNFNDNNNLLIEAQIKEYIYFTANIFNKVKDEYNSITTILRNIQLEDLKENNAKDDANDARSQQTDLINQQRSHFSGLQDEIKSINIDRIQNQGVMEGWQKTLKQRWETIVQCHEAIRKNSTGCWPDVTYELDYVQYKNMYETTMSLFNYKIDALLYPVLRVIPHIGIPTWRMFDNHSNVHPFAVKSIAWENFDRLGDVIRNNKISEGEKRQLLIRTFLTYQVYEPLTPEDSDRETEDNNQQNENLVAGGNQDQMVLPRIDEID